MNTQNDAPLDLLVDGEDDEHLSVSIATFDFCLQWRETSLQTLRAMLALLSAPSMDARELEVGKMFSAPLYLVSREGLYSFKCYDLRSGDLFKIDLTAAARISLADALTDMIGK